jgi:hypothetical protein
MSSSPGKNSFAWIAATVGATPMSCPTDDHFRRHFGLKDGRKLVSAVEIAAKLLKK